MRFVFIYVYMCLYVHFIHASFILCYISYISSYIMQVLKSWKPGKLAKARAFK